MRAVPNPPAASENPFAGLRRSEYENLRNRAARRTHRRSSTLFSSFSGQVTASSLGISISAGWSSRSISCTVASRKTRVPL